MTTKPNSKPWLRYLDRALWVALAAFFLYRCVLPTPSAPIGPELAATRLATAGIPTVVEFTSTR